MDCNPPGFSVHWILQARLLEWVTILFSRGSFRNWTWVFWIAGGFFFFFFFFSHLSHQRRPRIKTAAAAKSCPTLCDPTDSSLTGSSVPGILQARTLEWVAIAFSNAWKLKVKVKSLSHVRLLATPWTVAYKAPLSMGFSRQEYCSGLPLPSPRIKTNWVLFNLPYCCSFSSSNF